MPQVIHHMAFADEDWLVKNLQKQLKWQGGTALMCTFTMMSALQSECPY